jgi:predicted phosphodiesterase
LISNSGIALTESNDKPFNIHLSYHQTDLSTGITVTWQTKFSNSGSQVLYDNVSRSGNSLFYQNSSSGISTGYNNASGYIHNVELIGLKPNSTYYFICGGVNGGYSNERIFQTAPSKSSNLRFVVGGDCRSNWEVRDKISLLMSKYNPAFVMIAGDLVTSGSNQTQWNSFFNGLDNYWIGKNNLTIPIIPCLGNHEENSSLYFEQFALPGNEQWFSLNWGEQVHLIILNSEIDPHDEQLTWLENDLIKHQNYLWKFVMFHRPVFSSGSHGSWIDGREAWVPLFDKYGVDIVFSGHEHSYERSKPINYTASTISPQEAYSNGTMYIVTGGWGAPLYESGSDWWTEASFSQHHFVVVDIFGTETLNLNVINLAEVIVDEVLQKPPVISELPLCIMLPIFFTATLILVIFKNKIKNRFKF